MKQTDKPTQYRASLSSIVLIDDIKTPPGLVNKFDPERVEKAARSIIKVGALVRPLILRQVGIDEYELVDGELALLAAKHAQEIDPMFESICCVICDEIKRGSNPVANDADEESILEQLGILRPASGITRDNETLQEALAERNQEIETLKTQLASMQGVNNVDRTTNNDIITTKSGKPFTERGAKSARTRLKKKTGLEYDIITVDGGYGLQPVAPDSTATAEPLTASAEPALAIDQPKANKHTLNNYMGQFVPEVPELDDYQIIRITKAIALANSLPEGTRDWWVIKPEYNNDGLIKYLGKTAELVFPVLQQWCDDLQSQQTFDFPMRPAAANAAMLELQKEKARLTSKVLSLKLQNAQQTQQLAQQTKTGVTLEGEYSILTEYGRYRTKTEQIIDPTISIYLFPAVQLREANASYLNRQPRPQPLFLLAYPQMDMGNAPCALEHVPTGQQPQRDPIQITSNTTLSNDQTVLIHDSDAERQAQLNKQAAERQKQYEAVGEASPTEVTAGVDVISDTITLPTITKHTHTTSNTNTLGDRHEYIGMSDLSFILGIRYPDLPATFKTPTDVWLEKTGRASMLPNDRESMIAAGAERLWNGQVFEEPIAREIAARLNITLTNPQREYTHPQHDFIRAHVDFEFDYHGEECHLEVTTVDPRSPSFYEWGENGTSDVPFYKLVQVQGQMALSGKKRTLIAAALGFGAIRHYWIEADPELQQELMDIATEFWQYVKMDQQPPDNTNPCAQYEAYKRNTYLNDIEVTLPPNVFVEKHNKYQQTVQQRKQLQQEEIIYKTEILRKMGDASRASIPNIGTWERRKHNRSKAGWQLKFAPD